MTTTTSQPVDSIAHLLAEYANQRVHLNGLVRTLLDELDGRQRGGSYLNCRGNARWFNAADLRSHKNRDLLLNHFEYVSPAARDTLKSVKYDEDLPTEKRLVCDHVVPCSQMQRLLFEKAAQRIWTPECIHSFKSRYYRRCVITKHEDAKLLRTRMPTGWTTNNRVFARYDTAGFEWAKGFE